MHTVWHRDHPHTLINSVELTLHKLSVCAWPIHDGRVSHSSSATTFAYSALHTPSPASVPEHAWLPVDAAARALRPWPDYTAALSTCLDRFSRPELAFDSPDRVSEIDSWASNALSVRRIPIVTQRAIKSLRSRRLIQWNSHKHSYYLKAHATSLQEARITTALSAVCPEHFPTTLALDEERGWWLYRGYIGRALTLNCLSPELGSHIGSMLATIQQRFIDAALEKSLSAPERISATDMMLAAGVARTLMEGALRDRLGRPLPSQTAWEQLERACANLELLPESLIHCDLWPGNILVNRMSLGLIDLETAHRGPSPLMLSELVWHWRSAPVEAVASIISAYLAAWSTRTALCPLQHHLKDLYLSGRLFAFAVWLRRYLRSAVSSPQEICASITRPFDTLVPRLSDLRSAMLRE